MKSLVLAILATGLLLDGTNKAIAECQALAEAKASNPGSPLKYHLVAGARCWYAGSPQHRELPGAKGPGPAKLANDGKADQPSSRQEADQPSSRQEADQPPPRPEQLEFPTKAEMPEVLSEPSGTVQYRVADTFHVIALHADGPDTRQSLQTFERRVLGAHAESLEHDPAQDVQLSWQPSAQVGSDARNTMAVIRILLVIGIAIIIAIATAGLLSSFRHRASLTRTGSPRRHPGQGLNPDW